MPNKGLTPKRSPHLRFLSILNSPLLDVCLMSFLELKIRRAFVTLSLDQSPRRSAAPIVRGQGVEHLTQALILDVIVDGLERARYSAGACGGALR